MMAMSQHCKYNPGHWIFYLRVVKIRNVKMAQLVRAFTAKPDDLGRTRGTHMVEREHTPTNSFPPFLSHLTFSLTHTPK